jgi:hypothetical protein
LRSGATAIWRRLRKPIEGCAQGSAALSALCAEMEMTRQAWSRHLAILEKANAIGCVIDAQVEISDAVNLFV